MDVDLDTETPWDLGAVVGLLVVLDVVVALLPDSPLRLALGIPFVLVVPGYALVAALFPERHRTYEVPAGEAGGEPEVVEEGIDALERAALSVGLSIAVVPLIGLALNYTPWGIRLVPILVAVTGFVGAACLAGWLRRRRLPPERRFRVRLHLHVPAWGEMSRVDRVLNVALAAAVVLAAGTLGYVLLNPRQGETFTELYVLGPDRRASGYPSELGIGDNATVIVGVRNFEGRTVRYTVEAWMANHTGTPPNGTPEQLLFARRWTMALAPLDPRIEPGEPFEPQWERAWNLSIDRAGRWKVVLALHGSGLGGDVDPDARLEPGTDYAGTSHARRVEEAYRTVHFWVTVQGTGG